MASGLACLHIFKVSFILFIFSLSRFRESGTFKIQLFIRTSFQFHILKY
ncbi:hypothetical protein JCM19298_2995 [Nonlabens ulvanivorans]|nr:hypothetical protein JCM19297_2781 [Nonlabens ulvanivorans]GAK92507.1 hypothetical protein JCM19298_2995 [Nonlabens ulvanivorans]